MVKEEGEKIEGTEEGFGQKITTEAPAEEPKPSAAEEQLATLRREHDELKARYEQADKEARGAQATLTRKDREFKSASDLAARVTGIESTLEILAGKMLQGDLSPEEAQNFKNEVAAAKDSIRKETENVALRAQQEERNRTYEDMWQRALKFGTYDNNDNVADIYDALRSGNELRAVKILKKLEVTPTEKEPDEARIERLAEEKLRQKMEASGQLLNSTDLPSGSTDEARIREAYRSNPYGNKEYKDFHEMIANKKS